MSSSVIYSQNIPVQNSLFAHITLKLKMACRLLNSNAVTAFRNNRNKLINEIILMFTHQYYMYALLCNILHVSHYTFIREYGTTYFWWSRQILGCRFKSFLLLRVLFKVNWVLLYFSGPSQNLLYFSGP